MQAISMLSFLGYTVVAQEDGIYRFCCSEDADDPESPSVNFVGMFFAKTPITGEERMAKIQLLAIPCPGDELVNRIFDAWKSIDARRLEESGIQPYELEVGPLSPMTINEVRYLRPDGESYRHGIALPSGDVVCYN